MRGNRRFSARRSRRRGSIPAYAGEPKGFASMGTMWMVYPRVCGGTVRRQGQAGVSLGLSPRMRGNQLLAGDLVFDVGSIPAYAGEPWRVWPAAGQGAVYPRVCGGTRSTHRLTPACPGLSPRMRGNRAGQGNGHPGHWSIPAYAGEPCAASIASAQIWVYPRVCGGTVPAGCAQPHQQGLSPRMRGNRLRGCRSIRSSRSIPAYAGEPRGQSVCGSGCPVYPRVCGGTHILERSIALAEGLSPRMRGNRTRKPCAR